MNLNLVFRLVGRILTMEGITMVLPLLVALLCGESLTPFLFSIAIVVPLGLVLNHLPVKKKDFFTREGFAAAGMIWLLTALVGALPFWFSGHFASFVDCVFESASGFTTTGATVLTDIEILPKGILFWRAFTHWLGGMGVLVLATAILPAMGIRSHYLTQAESPGPVFSKLVPKQAQTSKILYTIYCSLTLLEALCLKLAGMPLYDSFIHAFSTAGTGGFSNRNASVGAYNSMTVDMIIAVFILLFSLNFAVHFLLLSRKWKEALSSDELRFFLLVVAGSTALLCINLYPVYQNLKETFRYAFFHVCSIISTTGFATTDWLYWPQFSQFILILLMFCGACAGSTGGGIKCSRILILLRSIRRECHRIVHPRSVEVVKLDGKVVEESTIHSIVVFVGCYLLIILSSGLVISLDNHPFEVSFAAALTCVSNVGPALGIAGPVGNFASFSLLSKMIMSLCMIVGRLEIIPVLVLFSPVTWKRT